MIRIAFQEVHKRFGQTRILSGFSAEFESGKAYHIAGSNGSGKSTFLKLVCANLSPDKGSVLFTQNGNPLDVDQVGLHTAFCAPYIELLDELTGREQIAFHIRFKPVFKEADIFQEIHTAGLTAALDKPLRLYSSGMKQRLKLILTFLSDTPLLLLDEPCSNLDESGRAFYASLAERYVKNRLVMVASNNMPEEHFFCTHTLIPSSGLS